MDTDLLYKQVKPASSLADFVDSFWMLQNLSDQPKDVIILPDGRIDLFLTQSVTEPFHIILLGLDTHPSPAVVAPRTRTFAISFNPLATEYVLHQTIADLGDNVRMLPDDFWNFTADDLTHFDRFVEKASAKIQSSINEQVDDRKRKLFALMYTSKGSMPVNELAQNVCWSSRQINRYFNQQYGISLKTYCSVLRFRASFSQLKEGKLFPEQFFADQAHFIKEIRKFSGTIPKELHRNKNDRFIQFSALPPE
jgi:AraC-like DNA-binding protein